ncbi:MAG: hypothetical protein JRH20_17870 [Deltaproteobacteria bacterium]|nr:hypothetical protein [Deltaproteobacteria bacterium]
MACHVCASSNMGMVSDLPDKTAEGQSYHAAASGTFTQHSVQHRDAIIGPADWEVTDPNKIYYAAKRAPRSPLGKLLSLLFSQKEVRDHHSTTKMGTIESLMCCDCGAFPR